MVHVCLVREWCIIEYKIINSNNFPFDDGARYEAIPMMQSQPR